MSDRTLDQWVNLQREIILQEQNSAIAIAQTSASQGGVVQAKLFTPLPGLPNPMPVTAWNQCNEGQQIFLFRADGTNQWYAIGAGVAQTAETRVVQNIRRKQPARKQEVQPLDVLMVFQSSAIVGGNEQHIFYLYNVIKDTMEEFHREVYSDRPYLNNVRGTYYGNFYRGNSSVQSSKAFVTNLGDGKFIAGILAGRVVWNDDILVPGMELPYYTDFNAFSQPNYYSRAIEGWAIAKTVTNTEVFDHSSFSVASLDGIPVQDLYSFRSDPISTLITHSPEPGSGGRMKWIDGGFWVSHSTPQHFTLHPYYGEIYPTGGHSGSYQVKQADTAGSHSYSVSVTSVNASINNPSFVSRAFFREQSFQANNTDIQISDSFSGSPISSNPFGYSMPCAIGPFVSGNRSFNLDLKWQSWVLPGVLEQSIYVHGINGPTDGVASSTYTSYGCSGYARFSYANTPTTTYLSDIYEPIVVEANGSQSIVIQDTGYYDNSRPTSPFRRKGQFWLYTANGRTKINSDEIVEIDFEDGIDYSTSPPVFVVGETKTVVANEYPGAYFTTVEIDSNPFEGAIGSTVEIFQTIPGNPTFKPRKITAKLLDYGGFGFSESYNSHLFAVTSVTVEVLSIGTAISYYGSSLGVLRGTNPSANNVTYGAGVTLSGKDIWTCRTIYSTYPDTVLYIDRYRLVFSEAENRYNVLLRETCTHQMPSAELLQARISLPTDGILKTSAPSLFAKV